MKYVLALAVLISLSFAATAQDAELVAPTPPGPFIKFSEMSHDFGDIEQGEKVAYTFEFTNTGDAPVVITNVLTTCGCTASSWPREPIAPGGSSKIDVTFNSTGKIGHQNKVITVMSNATNNPERVKIVTNILPKSES
ncbi:DUF1573 domain-containing protein [Reichenbachiella carrageenanivorans]|uniref:DUF1573 domain-containing protein n=1 Tax=Reichenbachiella carrageenanivorans TaxID=2979869 RepID=A0ABY6CW10_9BACT|nr:DUF1573 domain-containing protein [Reichenbachiella carrageenanivorans]UXX78096.1 DUF1573 domain-containing protein [Reichenbachiella carrageenanivorans]